MKKMFMGMRLRRLRAERGLSQIALAQTLGLSPSYLNQLEQNQRPLTVPVLLKIHSTLGVDVQAFSDDDDARLIAGLREALVDSAETVTQPELQALVTQMPALARAFIAMQRRSAETREQLEVMAERLGDGRAEAIAPRAMPFETVRDFFFDHRNHFDAIDRAAEDLAVDAGECGAGIARWLVQRLSTQHRVRVIDAARDKLHKRRYDPIARTLSLAASLSAGQRAFQLATQLALLEINPLLDAAIAVAPLTHDASARALARLGLANYFAGALLLPYREFLSTAEALRYDIDRLSLRFGVGVETVCHRLSTLQRPEAPGVPFFLVRVDRAGNISKRQSATHFHFSRAGGTCPLWTVYEAFGQPERTLTQLARMPDGRTYFWVARAVTHAPLGYGVPPRTFAIGLGCDVRHAARLVYTTGLKLDDPAAATPIGMGCKVCERDDCLQRAFPFVGRSLDVDIHQRRFVPYEVAR